jgi:serine protease Do
LLPPGISSATISASGKMYTLSVDGSMRAQSQLGQLADAGRSISPAAHDLKETNAGEDSSIGASAAGNPEVRHDGVVLSYVAPGGPADRAGLKPGDVILAIGDHYLFTANELNDEIGASLAGRSRKCYHRALKFLFGLRPFLVFGFHI